MKNKQRQGFPPAALALVFLFLFPLTALALPDLAISDPLTLSSASPSAQGLPVYLVGGAVSNEGDEEARDFEVLFTVNGRVAGTRRVEVLSPGRSFPLSFHWTPSQEGKNILRFTADPENSVEEPPNANNSATRDFLRNTASPVPRPSLAFEADLSRPNGEKNLPLPPPIEKNKTDPPPPAPQADTALAATSKKFEYELSILSPPKIWPTPRVRIPSGLEVVVRNSGHKRVIGARVILEMDSRPLQEKRLGYLYPGDSKRVTFSWVPTDTKEHRFAITVDPDDLFEESDESDNRVEKTAAARNR